MLISLLYIYNVCFCFVASREGHDDIVNLLISKGKICRSKYKMDI